MRLKLIACEVLTREIGLCIARSAHVIDAEFLTKGAHEPEDLRARIQAAVDAAESEAIAYDALLIGFGLCGNAMLGVGSRRYPMVIPRAHDCCTLYLGSKAAFAEHFGSNPSQGFTALGYQERPSLYETDGETESAKFRHKTCFGRSFAELVEQYGEDNAAYIWSTLHPQHAAVHLQPTSIYIRQPEIGDFGQLDQFRLKAEAAGKQLVVLDGSLELVRRLVDGEWDPSDFLIVQPGERLQGVYDLDEIVRAVPGDG